MMNDILNTIGDDSAQELAKASRIGTRKTKEDFKGFNPVYLNKAQKEIYTNAPRVTGIRAGRGCGKSTMLGIHTAQCSMSIPRGTGLFLTPSLKSCYTKLQPALVKSMEQVLGLYEGVQYVRERPNPRWHWPSPLAKPRTWDSSLSFYTGHITYFTSIQSKASGNGLNLSDLTADEFRYIAYDKFSEEIRPSVRGEMYDNKGWTDSNYLYKSIFLVSDAAVDRRQLVWETEMRRMITHDENEKLIDMLAELKVCPELMMLPKYIDALNHQKAKCVNLFEYSTLYNIEVLGEDYIRGLKMSMPKQLFDVQIMSQPLDAGADADAYYFCFNPDVHLYQPNEDDEINAIFNKTYKTHRKKTGIEVPTREWEAPDLSETSSHADDSLFDVDVDPKFPLCISFDVNANFNTVVVSQRIPHHGRTEIRVVNCLYTKYKDKLRALVSRFIGYYADHRNKHVIFTSDPQLRQGQSYALEDIENSRYDHVIRSMLERAGWEVEEENLGTPLTHPEKFQLINDVFAGNKPFDIRINRELDFLVLAINNTRVIDTRRGPAKFKGHEKLSSEEGIGNTLETRTDVTDALDLSILSAVKSTVGYAPKGTAGVIFTMPTIMG